MRPPGLTCGIHARKSQRTESYEWSASIYNQSIGSRHQAAASSVGLGISRTFALTPAVMRFRAHESNIHGGVVRSPACLTSPAHVSIHVNVPCHRRIARAIGI